MNEPLTVGLAAIAGISLGGMFFGGLWWTVRRRLSAPQAALWFLGSLLVRTSVVLAGFVLVARGDWRRLVACLVGFFVARPIVTRLVRASAGEARRAP